MEVFQSLNKKYQEDLAGEKEWSMGHSAWAVQSEHADISCNYLWKLQIKFFSMVENTRKKLNLQTNKAPLVTLIRNYEYVIAHQTVSGLQNWYG